MYVIIICHVSLSLSLALSLSLQGMLISIFQSNFLIASPWTLGSGSLPPSAWSVGSLDETLKHLWGWSNQHPCVMGLMMFDSCDLGSPVHTSSEHFFCDCRTLPLSKMGPEKKQKLLKACKKKSKHHRSAPMSASCILRISDGFASFTVSLRFSFPSAFAAFPSCHGPMMHKHQRLIYGALIQKTTCTITESSKLEVMFWLDKEWGMQSCHFSCYPSIGPFSQRLHWIISQNQPQTSLTSTISDNFFLVSFQICILSFPEVKRVRSHLKCPFEVTIGSS